jgi:hypothetical protein
LAHLVSTALEGQDPAGEKHPDNIIRAEVGLLLALLNKQSHPLGLLVVLRVVQPVGHGGRSRDERW